MPAEINSGAFLAASNGPGAAHDEVDTTIPHVQAHAMTRTGVCRALASLLSGVAAALQAKPSDFALAPLPPGEGESGFRD